MPCARDECDHAGLRRGRKPAKTTVYRKASQGRFISDIRCISLTGSAEKALMSQARWKRRSDAQPLAKALPHAPSCAL